MPGPDPLSRFIRIRIGKFVVVTKTFKRRRPGKKPEDGGVPVEPNRPNTLSGGAAAALEFDE